MANVQNNHSDIVCDERIPGFCATRSKSGTQSKCSKNLEEFLPLIEEATIAWVDYIVDDFEKEAAKTAAKAGFSESLVTRLLKNIGDKAHARGGYEDVGAEMGLLLPSINVVGFQVTVKPLLILLKKNLVLTIHTMDLTHFFQLHRYAGGFLKKLPEKLQQNDWLTLLLIRIIDENNYEF